MSEHGQINNTTERWKIYQELIIDENYNLVEKTDDGNGFCVFEKK